MDINAALNKVGKNITNEDVLEKVKCLMNKYNMTEMDMGFALSSYLISNNIDNNDITFQTIEAFEKKEFIFRLHQVAAVNLPAPKPIQQQIYDKNVCNLLNEYQNGPTHQHYISNMDIDDNIEYPTSISSWPLAVFNSDEIEYMYQLNRRILDVNEENALQLFRKRLEYRNRNQINESSMLNLSDMSPVDTTNQDIYICGTIVIDHSHATIVDNGGEGHAITTLTTDNIAIEGLSSIKFATVPLNLEEMKSYSFFRGQHAVLKGHNSSKTGFSVTEVLPIEVSPCLPIEKEAVLDDLIVLIACGPFNFNNTDDDRFLEAILTKVQNRQCDALILIGPFADENNEAIKKRTEFDLESTILSEKLTLVARRCIKLGVHVVIVPSVEDIGHNEGEFPQQQFNLGSNDEVFKNELVHFVSNPALFNIGPYRFGVTSADILRHMVSQEIGKGGESKIKRLLRHVIDENNFYPLKPASSTISVDWPMWRQMCDFGANPPHCLILPSILQTFCEDVGGVLCVNPGFVVKNNNAEKIGLLKISASKIQDGSNTIIPAMDFELIRIETV